MMTFPDAQYAAVAACDALKSERVTLLASVGRFSAARVIADADLIPFARSAMDGFAVAAADLAKLPVTLPVAARTFAGRANPQSLHERGTATAIMTGAPLPSGADAVLPIEDIEVAGDFIRIDAAVERGDAVFPPGEDALRGDVLIESGIRVTPAMLGLLAAAGHTDMAVSRRPRVTLICSGDELVSIDAQPGHGQIRNSNAAVLRAALEAFGVEVCTSITVPDSRDAIRNALDTSLLESDLVVTTGGASVGERDYIKAICVELGVAFVFNTVALRPAKPTAFGRRGTARIAVLPGNPAAAFVAFHQFVLPALRAMCGASITQPPRVVAMLDGFINAKPGRHFAAFAELTASSDGLSARPLINQCSSLTRTVADTCGLIIVPPGTTTYKAGDRVNVDIIDWTKLRQL